MNKQDWTYKKLGEVCDIFGRIGFRGYTREDYVNTIEEGAISLSPSNIINNRLDFSNCTYITWDKYNQSPEIMISKGDVIFVKTASVGKCAFVSELPHESTINPQFVVFKNIKISNRFLFHELLSPTFQYKVQRIKSGTSVPTITQKGLSELEISYPPLAEQERIVAELDLLSGIIEKKKEQLKAYDQLAQSIFYTMFGDPIDNPKGWEVKKLKEVSTLINGRAYKQNELLSEGKYKVLRVGNFFTNSNFYYSDLELEDNKYCDNGDLLFAWSASFGAFIWNGGKVIFHYHIWKVLYDEQQLNKIFYRFLLNTMTNAFMNDVHGIGMVHLTKQGMEEYNIPIPPLSLQEEFAEKIEAIERQKALVQQSIEETQTMFDCTMDKYFG